VPSVLQVIWTRNVIWIQRGEVAWEGHSVLTYIWIGLGSALGGMGRYWCTNVVARHFGEHLPWGTIIVNVSGSLLIGILAGLVSLDGRPLVSPDARALLMVGLCGGYTTFSSFSLQTLNLARSGDWLWAGANIFLSVVVCLIAVWLGYQGGAALSR
jgi:CrcB protein